jgi:3'(2'), 5'-bisphosphate nucleotidase
MSRSLSLQKLLPHIVSLAYQAGEAVMKVYAQADMGTTYKDCDSPLTRADTESHNIIVEDLRAFTPMVPVLSEESSAVSYEARRQWQTFWLIDPLDGTKEFIQRNGEFTVNIALIKEDRPILGIVHAPAMDVTYFAAQGIGAFKEVARTRTTQIAAGKYQSERLKVVVSRSHPSKELETLLNRIGPHECIGMGSSLKICLVAEGAADFYPRLGPTMEWDTAAAQCVVEAAGGSITDISGRALKYNKSDMHNPDFIVTGAAGFQWQSYFHGGEAAVAHD